jgi:hypothetical protein
MSDSREQRRKDLIQLSDDRVKDSLYAQGFYDSWITPELNKVHRKVMEAKLRSHIPLGKTKIKTLIPGDYD